MMYTNRVLLASTALLSALTYAQQLEFNDLPSQCQEVCQPAVAISNICDRNDDDQSSTFISCMCTSDSSNTLLPLCEACVANYDPNDGDDNNANDIVQSCSFTRVSWSDSLTTIPPDVQITVPSVPVTTTTGAPPTTVTGEAPTVTSEAAATSSTGTGGAEGRSVELVGLGAAVLGVLGVI